MLSLEKIQKEQSTLVENRLDDYYTEEELRELDPESSRICFKRNGLRLACSAIQPELTCSGGH
ncbi:hypothetical protein [Paenibacillus sp. USHLN196]|uniref:hypothetical protein n=1 Tax=Paenibacillus sp. USHLN196 TaxID=3081291 RepID=UPI003015F596